MLSKSITTNLEDSDVTAIYECPDDIPNMVKCLDYKAAATKVNAPQLTSILPHVIILNNLIGITDHMSDCFDAIVSKVKEELNSRFVEGDRHQANVMLDEVQKVHHEIRSLMQSMQGR